MESHNLERTRLSRERRIRGRSRSRESSRRTSRRMISSVFTLDRIPRVVTHELCSICTALWKYLGETDQGLPPRELPVFLRLSLSFADQVLSQSSNGPVRYLCRTSVRQVRRSDLDVRSLRRQTLGLVPPLLDSPIPLRQRRLYRSFHVRPPPYARRHFYPSRRSHPRRYSSKTSFLLLFRTKPKTNQPLS